MAEAQAAPLTQRVQVAEARTRAQFYVHSDRPCPLIEVRGEIDLSNADALARCLSVIDPGCAVMLDLVNLTFIDSQGIGVLAQTCNRGVEVICRVSHPIVRRALEVSGMDSILTIQS